MKKNTNITDRTSDQAGGVHVLPARPAKQWSSDSWVRLHCRNRRPPLIRAWTMGPVALLSLLVSDSLSPGAAAGKEEQSVSGDAALYATIDAHALAAPPEVRRSIPALAAWLAAPARNEREKARAIFRWMTANVSYADDEADQALDSRPEAVLERGTSVCAGYSDLFVSLARAAGLEAVSIGGWAKGYGTLPGSRFGGPKNHAWNAVRIDGEWRLVDCTWGAGSVDEGGIYRKRFEAFYFLTPPGNLRYSHFPKETRWQLIEPSLSLAEFEALPFLRPAFFRCRLSELEPHAATIQVCDPLMSVRFNAPRDVLLLVRLFRESESVAPAGLRVRSQKERRTIDMLLPEDGGYILRVYVSRGQDVPGKIRNYRGALEYRIEASGGVPAGSIGSYLRKKARGDQGGTACGKGVISGDP